MFNVGEKPYDPPVPVTSVVPADPVHGGPVVAPAAPVVPPAVPVEAPAVPVEAPAVPVEALPAVPVEAPPPLPAAISFGASARDPPHAPAAIATNATLIDRDQPIPQAVGWRPSE
jgi:hypothetical protein